MSNKLLELFVFVVEKKWDPQVQYSKRRGHDFKNY